MKMSKYDISILKRLYKGEVISKHNSSRPIPKQEIARLERLGQQRYVDVKYPPTPKQSDFSHDTLYSISCFGRIFLEDFLSNDRREIMRSIFTPVIVSILTTLAVLLLNKLLPLISKWVATVLSKIST